MEKKNRHSWDPLENTGKLKHAECIYCQLQKWWDARFKRLIYQDRYGKIYYRTPSCTHVPDISKRFKVPAYFNK